MGLLVANLTVAAALAGLIWTIQVVHYPLFAGVGVEGWTAYEAEHQRRITRVVLPLMLANVGLAVAVLVDHHDALGSVNAAIAGGQFAATGAYYAPIHGRLAAEHSAERIRALVRANWLRTAGWTVQVAVAAALVLR
ncbi:hypothetical protein DSM112329_03357 [Paraconexibacter sp. AEG42_29]|uniref:DUF1772 domain-containing protein n=1 Tax=Paraconexibacter sp. AEG42_29 TaxID=2997339 RepID=A0AAU7AXP2_9ACTN